MIEWDKLFKVQIASSDISFHKHEVVKLMLVLKLLDKHKSERSKIRIYTEFYVINSRKADVYYENIKSKESYIYEIQKEYTNRWLEELTKAYEGYRPLFVESFDIIVIPLKECPDSIPEINKWLDKYLL